MENVIIMQAVKRPTTNGWTRVFYLAYMQAAGVPVSLSPAILTEDEGRAVVAALGFSGAGVYVEGVGAFTRCYPLEDQQISGRAMMETRSREARQAERSKGIEGGFGLLALKRAARALFYGVKP